MYEVRGRTSHQSALAAGNFPVETVPVFHQLKLAGRPYHGFVGDRHQLTHELLRNLGVVEDLCGQVAATLDGSVRASSIASTLSSRRTISGRTEQSLKGNGITTV
jgi:hypothetical protein